MVVCGKGKKNCNALFMLILILNHEVMSVTNAVSSNTFRKQNPVQGMPPVPSFVHTLDGTISNKALPSLPIFGMNLGNDEDQIVQKKCRRVHVWM